MRRQATVRSAMDRPAQAYTSKATAARPFGDRSGAATSLTGSTLNNPVRRDPEVRQALSSWWEAAMASARASGRPEAGIKAADQFLTRLEFMLAFTTIHAAMQEEGSRFDPAEGDRWALREWDKGQRGV